MKRPLFRPKPFISVLLILGLSLILSACSNTEKVKPKYKTIQTMNQQQKVESGIIIAISKVPITPQEINSYGNIGLAASSGGFKGIYGSIDLTTLSRIFKNTTKPQFAQEVIVRKDNGQTVAITQKTTETFNKGERVKILLRNGEMRVIH